MTKLTRVTTDLQYHEYVYFDTVADFLGASLGEILAQVQGTPPTVLVGVLDGNHTYSVASDQTGAYNLTTTAGVKATVLPADNGYNIRAFGAVGGVDCTAAIASALAAAAAVTDYATVAVPADPSGASYLFTEIEVPSRVTLRGLGGVLKLKDGVCTDNGTAYYLIHNLGHSETTFVDLIVDGNGANNTLFQVADTITCTGIGSSVMNCILLEAPDSGIMFSGTDGGSCADNYIKGATDVGIYVNANEGSGLDGYTIARNIVRDCLITGIALKRQSSKVSVLGNTILGCPNAISYEDFGETTGGHPDTAIISGNTVTRCTGNAFQLNRLTNSVVANNTLSEISGFGIFLSGATNSVITSNTVSGSGSESTTVAGIATSDRTDPTSGLVTVTAGLSITNNVVSNYGGRGAHLFTGSDIVFSGNVLRVSSQAFRLESAVSSVVVTGNTFDGTLGDTILPAGAAYIIRNNIIGGVLSTGYRTITAGQPLPTNVSSSVTGLYVGEELLHLAGPYWYKAYGTGPQEWVLLG